MENNTVYLHVCGGGAYSIANQIKDKILGNTPDFPKVVTNYIDTTEINIKSDFLKTTFFKIESVLTGDNHEVSGSGGDRANHIDSKVAGVREYVNKNKFLTAKADEYHIVLFTCGGGSGSTIGPALVRELKSKGMTVIAFCVADSSTIMTASNSISTLAGIDKMMRAIKVSLPIFYYDNGSITNKNITASEEYVNGMILSDMNLLLAFLSTSKTDIDNADMHLFLDQTKYSGKYASEPGIMEMLVVNDQYAVSQDSDIQVTMCRTLLREGEESQLKVDVLQRKVGKLTGNTICEKLSSYTPLNIISLVNSMSQYTDILNNKVLSRNVVKNNAIESVEDVLDF